MRKSFSFLFSVGVCALMQVGAAAQSVETATQSYSPEVIPAARLITTGQQPLFGEQLRTKMDEAKQLLKSHAVSSGGNTVTLAAFDPQGSALHLLNVEKDSFLKRDVNLVVTSQLGRPVRLTVVRANGVNTAVTVNDASSGQALVPLMVAYPIVKAGAVTEIAYYTSAHPALVSDDTSSAGEAYIRTMLNKAAQRLSENGVRLDADVVNIAEHLCIVEHTDHKRFMTEAASNLFPEILSLYTFNEGNTFRYSVSTAGAGGMIQMIPRTYEMVRQQHATVPLQTDFVTGMRDHANALEAMLLYMNDTWKTLAENSEVEDALRSGVATKPELLAAGYNSNPARLPMYLKHGGANWKTLIPAETQMYLTIYKTVDSNVNFHRNGTANPSIGNAKTSAPSQIPRIVSLAAWVDSVFQYDLLNRIF
ncbi:MAG: hypothetical protein ABR607_06055 [Pyrinomonadaceae bacterium]